MLPVQILESKEGPAIDLANSSPVWLKSGLAGPLSHTVGFQARALAAGRPASRSSESRASLTGSAAASCGSKRGASRAAAGEAEQYRRWLGDDLWHPGCKTMSLTELALQARQGRGRAWSSKGARAARVEEAQGGAVTATLSASALPPRPASCQSAASAQGGQPRLR